jgi:hypothetical protein
VNSARSHYTLSAPKGAEREGSPLLAMTALSLRAKPYSAPAHHDCVKTHPSIMAGLVPAIHALRRRKHNPWMPGTRPGMTGKAASGNLRGNEAKQSRPAKTYLKCGITSLPMSRIDFIVSSFGILPISWLPQMMS